MAQKEDGHDNADANEGESSCVQSAVAGLAALVCGTEVARTVHAKHAVGTCETPAGCARRVARTVVRGIRHPSVGA